MKKQFLRFDVFKIPVTENGSPAVPIDPDEQQDESRLRLTTLATNDVATSEIENDMLKPHDEGKRLLFQNVNGWLIEKNVGFFEFD